jgi:hypothetical protein
MTGDSTIQNAFKVFLGITPDKITENYLPSTRSIAFRKEVWKDVGGFNEKLKDTAEDTDFNYKLIKRGTPITIGNNALVEWGMPVGLKEGLNKMYKYAKGDAKTNIYYYSWKNQMSHNIKILIKILFWSLFLLALIYFVFNWNPGIYFLSMVLLAYLIWSFKKVYNYTNEVISGAWGVIIQITSDFIIMYGFLNGILKK